MMPHPQLVYAERLDDLLLPGMRWLDLGCGRSLLPEWLPDAAIRTAQLRTRAACVVGVDVDPSALQNNQSCIHRVLGTTTQLPFTPGSFDLVTSNMVFEHLPRPAVAITEIRRVLRPGGRMLLHTPNWLYFAMLAARIIPQRWHPWLLARLDGRPREDSHPKYYAFNRPERAERILRAAGFTQFRVQALAAPALYKQLPVVGQIETIWHVLGHHLPSVRATLLIEAELT